MGDEKHEAGKSGGFRGIPLASGAEFTKDEKLFDGIEEGILIATDEGSILDANAAALRLLGRTREDIASAARNDIFWDSQLREAVEERRREGSFRGRLRLARGDGTTFDAEVSAIELEDRNVGIVFHDAGRDHEPAGHTLDEGFFKALVENRAGIVILSGEDGVIRYASPSTRRILGHEPEEVVGEPLSEHLHPGDRGRVMSVFHKESAEGSRVSGIFRLRHGGGGWVGIEGSIENFLGEPGIGGVALAGRELPSGGGESVGFEEKLRGVAERLEESERRLRESEKLFRTTFDQAPVGLAHVGVDGRWIRENKKLCENLGHPRQELLGRTFQEITHTEDLASDLQTMKAMIAGESDSASVEKRYVKKDFTHVWVSVSASLVHGEDGKPRYFICTIEDITKIKEAQLIAQSLNDREMRILKLLSRGMTNREIATEMNFSLSSAKVHVGRVMEKLGATDRTNAAVRAAGLGIL